MKNKEINISEEDLKILQTITVIDNIILTCKREFITVNHFILEETCIGYDNANDSDIERFIVEYELLQEKWSVLFPSSIPSVKRIPLKDVISELNKVKINRDLERRVIEYESRIKELKSRLSTDYYKLVAEMVNDNGAVG